MNDATTPQSRTTLILMAALAVLLAIVWILVKEGHEAWSGEDEPPA